MTAEALAILEGNSLAKGLVAIDACIKRAQPLTPSLRFVSPGKFVLWLTGPVGEVEESFQAGKELLGGDCSSSTLIRGPHISLLGALKAFESQQGIYRSTSIIGDDAVGLFEWDDNARAYAAIDRVLKELDVTLVFLRLAKGIGGKTMTLFSGVLSEVESARDLVLRLEHAAAFAQIIARPDPIWVGQMESWLETTGSLNPAGG